MRPLEYLLLGLLALTLVGRLWRRAGRPRWMRYLPAVLVAVVLLQVAVEHYRWQMVPAYLLVAVLAATALRRPAPAPPPGWGRRIGRGVAVLFGLLGVGVSWLFGAGFPIFEYPKPSGPYGVGTAQLFFVDRARVDSFAPTPGQPRELLAAVWYPADVPPGAPRDPFWPPGYGPSAAIGMPDFLFSHVSLVPAYSTAGAPVARAETRYPTIVFSHGYNSIPWQNVPQMEELASHGFIVVSLGHTYDATVLRFPDGREVRDNSRTRPPVMSLADERAVLQRTRDLNAERDPARIKSMWREIQAFMRERHYYIAPSVAVWVADTRFVLDQLAAIDSGRTEGVVGPAKLLAGRMALDRLGLFGMSFGGSTTGLVCMVDSRCKAGLNFDGWQFGDPDATPLAVPFMYLTGGWNHTFPVYDRSTADLYEVHVKRAEHGNFDDLSLVGPLFTWISRPSLPMLGTIDGPAMERIMTTYSLAFFERYLKGTPQPILRQPAPPEMPDVAVTARLAPEAPPAR